MLIEQDVIIRCSEGLHARPAASLVRIANGYNGKITLLYRDKTIDAKSILSILSAGIGCGERIRVTVDGEGAAAMMNDLLKLLIAGEVHNA